MLFLPYTVVLVAPWFWEKVAIPFYGVNQYLQAVPGASSGEKCFRAVENELGGSADFYSRDIVTINWAEKFFSLSFHRSKHI